MLRFLRFKFLLVLIFIISIAQYGSVAFVSALKGNVVLWQMDNHAAEGAGLFRYIKDAFLLCFSFLWPIYALKIKLPKVILNIISIYFVWFGFVLGFGSIGMFFGYSSMLFMMAGLRWLMLLHASFGVFILMHGSLSGLNYHKNIIYCLIGFGAIDLLLISWQLSSGQAAYGLALGQSRLTGLFSNAGVAGFFGLALALTGMQLDGASFKLRLMLSCGALIIGLSSGTRSMIMAVFFITSLQVIEYVEGGAGKKFRIFLKITSPPILLIIMWIGYQWMIGAVDRGGILDAQLAGGGRISNFVNMLDILSLSDTGEFLFGRGLGVGTNTAYGMLEADGIEPSKFRFNWLIDNAFLTQFFQFGLIGSLIFWIGIFCFCVAVKPLAIKKYRRRYWLTVLIFFVILWVGNPFEHYLLMMPYAISFGCVYWGSYNQKKLIKSLSAESIA